MNTVQPISIEGGCRTRHRTAAILLLLLFLIMSAMPGKASGADGDNDGLDDDEELTLAETYAPILQFEGKERCFPVSIPYHLNNSNLNLSRSEDEGDLLVDPAPSVARIGNLTDPDEKYYLDNRLGTIHDDGIEEDYASQEGELGYTVYARVTPVVYRSRSYIVIQYWMFYAFNRGPLNTHEGDWEVVQIVLDRDDKPLEAMYSQHTSGERAPWDLVVRDGNHPTVFVARGSHANYFRPYQGRLSLANDAVGDSGKRLGPGDYELVLLGEKGKGDHPEDQAWLMFAGRWGEYGGDEDELRGKRGPQGPVYREEGAIWNDPMGWGRDLDEVTATTLRLNWFFHNFVMIFLTLAGIGLFLKILRIRRDHRASGVGKRIFSILYLERPNLASLGNLLTIIAMGFAVAALFLPWYRISIDVDSGDYRTHGMVDVLTVSGDHGVMVNTLESGQGMIQVFAFPLPFSFIIGLGLFFLILATVGVRESRVLGRKYLVAGLKIALPVLLILVVVSRASSMEDLLPVELEDEQQDVLDTASRSPWGGRETTQVGEYGTAEVEWGLARGGWYLAYSGILLFMAGILGIISGSEFYRRDPGSRETVDGIRKAVGIPGPGDDGQTGEPQDQAIDRTLNDKENFLRP